MAENQSKSPAPDEDAKGAEGAKTDRPEMKSVVLADDLVPGKFQDAQLVAVDAKDLIKCYALSRRPRPLFYHGGEEIEMHVGAGSEEDVYMAGNTGLFSSILAAYNNHWPLRTCPEDWWFCVTRRIAIAIDKHNDKESVQKFFVDHQDFKDIIVDVPDKNLRNVKHSWFLDEMTKAMHQRAKFPEFVEGMAADFGTTTAVKRFASQVSLMYSVQEYFHFGGMYLCGIPALEMLGTEEDWEKLTSKLKELRALLAPIGRDLRLRSDWWGVVEKVFSELLAAYRGNPDKKWWSHIISHQKEFASGLPEYQGWITEFLEGTKEVIDIGKMTTGLVSVILELHKPSGMTDIAKLVTGMVGFTLHNNDAGSLSVKPFHGWAVLLRDDSPYLPKNARKFPE